MNRHWHTVALALTLMGMTLGGVQHLWAGAIFESMADTPCEESPCNPHPGNPKWHYLYQLDNRAGSETLWGVEFLLPAGTIVPLASVPNWTRVDLDVGPFHVIRLRANNTEAAVQPGEVLSGFHLNSEQGPGLSEVHLSRADGGIVGTGTTLAPSAVPQPSMLLTLAGCKTCSVGQEFIVRVRALHPNLYGAAIPVEVKAGVILPDGTAVNISKLADKHFTVALAPGTDVRVELFRALIPNGLPSGTWRYFGVLAHPEDATTLSRTTQPFTVGP